MEHGPSVKRPRLNSQKLVRHLGYTRIDAERDRRAFWSVTENLCISVSAQADKATGFVARATHRSGQPRSPALRSDDNHVFCVA
jgi:hypothetical protein